MLKELNRQAPNWRILLRALALMGLPLTTVFAWMPSGFALGVASPHSGPGKINHPVHVLPSSAVRIPEDWPLDANGAISCTTCHSSVPSGNEVGQPRLRSSARSPTSEKVFCANCHLSDGPRTAVAMHWMGIARAHIHTDTDAGGEGKGLLDAESRLCLSCHDGVGAGETAYETGIRPHAGSFGDRGRNHPVGIDYPHGGKSRKGVQYHLPTALPQAVRLPGGTVGCVSCHNLYSAEPMHLSVQIEGSSLCFACHDMN